MAPDEPHNQPGRHESMQSRVAAMAPWFHNLHLPDGTQTAPDHPLGDFPAKKWRQLAAVLPTDCTGWTVLDIGCNAGFYSLALAQRGAQVTAVEPNGHYLDQARWAATQWGLTHRITFHQTSLYALGRDSTTYDLVLFLGVFYHLRYPLLGLDIATRKTRRLLCFQSLTLPDADEPAEADDIPLMQRDRLLQSGWPKAAFVERYLSNDPTVWWVPNGPCMEAMLRNCGMRQIAHVEKETWVCEPDPNARPFAHDRDWPEYAASLGLSGELAVSESSPGSSHSATTEDRTRK